MSEQAIVKHMIEFVEETERQLQSNKLISESQLKNDVIKAILEELEGKTSDED